MIYAWAAERGGRECVQGMIERPWGDEIKWQVQEKQRNTAGLDGCKGRDTS